MINQKTFTTFDTATFHLSRFGSSTLKRRILQSTKEKTTERFEGALLGILEADYMR